MTRRGRPLWFLVTVLCGWTGARVAILWPQTGSLPEALRQAVPFVAQAAPLPVVTAPPARRPQQHVATSRALIHRPHRPQIGAVAVPASDPFRVQMALFASTRFGAPIAIGPAAAPPTSPPAPWLPSTKPPAPSGWSGSAWLVARPGTGIGAAPGAGQLGGSQAGMRIAYMLLPRQRLAAVARVTAPLRGRGAEASLGVEWQPTRLPVRLVAERRFGLDGVSGGFGAGAIAGVDTMLPASFRLESYAQAGAIRRRRTEPYADGAVRVTRKIVTSGDLRLAFGAGTWGAAQRDAARLDIGPSAALSYKSLRLTFDWRQRIAGDARPGSGPALSLGTDF